MDKDLSSVELNCFHWKSLSFLTDVVSRTTSFPVKYFRLTKTTKIVTAYFHNF